MKAKVGLALLSGDKTSAELCREHEVKSQLLYQWRGQFLSDAHLVFERSTAPVNAEEQVADLERKVGRLRMEVDVAKKASTRLGTSKNGHLP